MDVMTRDGLTQQGGVGKVRSDGRTYFEARVDRPAVCVDNDADADRTRGGEHRARSCFGVGGISTVVGGQIGWIIIFLYLMVQSRSSSSRGSTATSMARGIFGI